MLSKVARCGRLKTGLQTRIGLTALCQEFSAPKQGSQKGIFRIKD